MTAPLRTLADIDAAIARAEATLADYRRDLTEREAERQSIARARELVRLIEKRLTMLHDRKHIAEAAEGLGRPDTWGWRSP